MRFIDDEKEVIGKVVEQAGRARSGRASRQMPGIILHARTESEFAQHLHVVARALFEALGFQGFSFLFQDRDGLSEFGLDGFQGAFQFGGFGDEVLRGKDQGPLQFRRLLTAQRFERVDGVNALVPERDPDRRLFVGGEDVDDRSLDAKPSGSEFNLVALVVACDETLKQFTASEALSALDFQTIRLVVLRRSDVVDARDGGDDDNVAAREKGTRRLQSQAVDVLVDGRVFFNVGVGGRNIRLGLIVVVVRDEILHRVLRKQRLVLRVQLGGENLVGREDQGGTIQRFQRLADRKGFPAAGDAQKDLMTPPFADSRDERFYGPRLISGRGEIGDEFKGGHRLSSIQKPLFC